MIIPKLSSKSVRRSSKKGMESDDDYCEPEKECLYILLDNSTKMDGSITFCVKFYLFFLYIST